METLHSKIIDSMHAASKDITRFHLCGVLLKVQETTCVLYATDGHIMSKITLSKRETPLDMGDYWIPRDDVARIKALGSEYVFKKSEVRFPDCEQFIPQPQEKYECGAVALNINYMERLAKVLNKKKSAGVRFKIKDANSPVVLEHTNDEFEAVLIIMPMRI